VNRQGGTCTERNALDDAFERFAAHIQTFCVLPQRMAQRPGRSAALSNLGFALLLGAREIRRCEPAVLACCDAAHHSYDDVFLRGDERLADLIVGRRRFGSHAALYNESVHDASLGVGVVDSHVGGDGRHRAVGETLGPCRWSEQRANDERRGDG